MQFVDLFGSILMFIGGVMLILHGGIWQQTYGSPCFEKRPKLRDWLADKLPAKPGYSLVGLALVIFGFFFQFLSKLFAMCCS